MPDRGRQVPSGAGLYPVSGGIVPLNRPACMTAAEMDAWTQANRQAAQRASWPCQDCTADFAEQMRAEGHCDGRVGSEGPVRARLAAQDGR